MSYTDAREYLQDQLGRLATDHANMSYRHCRIGKVTPKFKAAAYPNPPAVDVPLPNLALTSYMNAHFAKLARSFI